MRYAQEGIFNHTNISEIVKVLKKAPQDYSVWIRHIDAYYPIVGISVNSFDEDDVVMGLASEETYGRKPSKSYTIAEMIDQMDFMVRDGQAKIDTTVFLESATNLDVSLDMQMEEPCCISGWGICNTCNDFVFLAGDSYWYT